MAATLMVTDNPEALVVEVEQTGRGAYATVVDGGRFHRMNFFGSTPDVALRCLLAKVDQAATCPLCSKPLNGERHFHLACAERENAVG